MGRVYENCKEAVNEIERDVMEMGIRVAPHSMQNKDVKGNDDFSTLEVQNYTFTILDTSDRNKIVKASLKWCIEEFNERVSHIPINPGIAWKLRKEVWEEFLNKEGEFDYTYNNRFLEYNQLTKIMNELRANPDTRQAILHVHFPEDVNSFQRKRMPCSMYYQFMIRRGKLDVIYNMRSSDFDTHFKNDIWQACELRDLIASKIKIQSGLFMMNIGSLHRYKNYTTKHVF